MNYLNDPDKAWEITASNFTSPGLTIFVKRQASLQLNNLIKNSTATLAWQRFRNKSEWFTKMRQVPPPRGWQTSTQDHRFHEETPRRRTQWPNSQAFLLSTREQEIRRFSFLNDPIMARDKATLTFSCVISHWLEDDHINFSTMRNS